MRAPAGIGFDFDHTLGFDNGLERRALYQVAENAGRAIPSDDPNATARVDALLAAFRGGSFGVDAMIERFGAQFGLPQLDPDVWRAQCYALVDELVEPVSGARALLAVLHAAPIPLAILTNGWSPLQQMKIARALGPQAIATVLVSDRLGVAKPERAAFDALVDTLAVPRDRIWYVGDNARVDAGGALAAGLGAVWFDAQEQPYPDDQPAPTLRIRALRELETLTQNTIAP